MSTKDVSWMAIGSSIVVGSSERPDYERAFVAAGFKMADPVAAPDYGAEAIRFTRIG